MKQLDQILRFVIEHTPIRGQLISLDDSWKQSIQHIEGDDFVRNLLGQALCAVSLLASTLKIEGKITLQIRGQGAIHLLVAQATSDNTIRGLIRQNSSVRDSSVALADIFQADKIVITIDNGKNKPHQGIVPLSGYSIAEALEAYFEQSEQLPTRLWLASNKSSAGGLLLQKLPGDMQDDDAWNRITQLGSTITDEELLNLPAPEILYRLFHEESLRLFDPEPMKFSCSCSKQRSLEMIKSLGLEEAMAILKEQGGIHINCEFCNASYDFDRIDIEQLFNPDIEPGNQTLH